MAIMKHKSALILLLCFQIATAQHKEAFVKVISATTQDWIGGAKGMSGTTYIIKLRILSGKPIYYRNMWLNNQLVNFEAQTFFTDPDKKPAEGDSIQLVYVKRNNYKADEMENKPLPLKYRGEALLEYLADGKVRYIIIKKFNKLKVIKGI